MTPSPADLHAARSADLLLAAALFAVDPAGLGGVVVRSGAGPVRDLWMERLRALLPAEARVGRAPAGVGDDRLLGGLDLAASLAAGRPVVEPGVLAAHDGGVVVMPMAERMEDATAARVCAVLDTGAVVIEREGAAARLPTRLGLVLLDEGAAPDERPPTALADRLALRVDLDGVRPQDLAAPTPSPGAATAAREALARVAPLSDEVVEALCAAAAALGLASVRPPILAARAARAHAALEGRGEVTVEDAAAAVRLVLAPRALHAPAEPSSPGEEAQADEPAEGAPAEPSASDTPAEAAEERRDGMDGETLVAAAQAVLPDGLLQRIVADNARTARAPRRSGGGEAAKSARRGRPLGSRAGRLKPGDRLDLPATLRAATPWRKLRQAREGVIVPVRPQDLRIRRFVQRRESTTIFVVDASGSAAFQRLAEAKGAVELLLADAYVSRARVALVAFRDTGAQVLLEPTRSLTRAKRSLADLPGGGGTPLASGLELALALAAAERARDRTPLLVVLTDGRANIGRDGAPGRAAAERDALLAAARIGEAGIGAAFLDTSPRPAPGGDRFARAMRAVYAPLPYADAHRVRAAVDGLERR